MLFCADCGTIFAFCSLFSHGLKTSPDFKANLLPFRPRAVPAPVYQRRIVLLGALCHTAVMAHFARGHIPPERSFIFQGTCLYWSITIVSLFCASSRISKRLEIEVEMGKFPRL